MTLGETKHLHPFEKAGLGIAPFKFVRMFEDRGPKVLADGITTIGSPGQPMNSCDFCGTAIADCYQIKSADNKMFVVGCDCVGKLAKASNKKSDPVLHEIVAKANAVKTQRRHERDDAKIADGIAFIAANESKLAKIAHPIASRAAKGESLLDSVKWYMANAGRSGKLDAIKSATKAVASFDAGSYVPVNAEAKAVVDAKVALEQDKADVVEIAFQWCSDNAGKLSKMPHSKGWRNSNLWLELQWLRNNASRDTFLNAVEVAVQDVMGES
jgi:hypothetical protein